MLYLCGCQGLLCVHKYKKFKFNIVVSRWTSLFMYWWALCHSNIMFCLKVLECRNIYFLRVVELILFSEGSWTAYVMYYCSNNRKSNKSWRASTANVIQCVALSFHERFSFSPQNLVKPLRTLSDRLWFSISVPYSKHCLKYFLVRSKLLVAFLHFNY